MKFACEVGKAMDITARMMVRMSIESITGIEDITLG